jgi:hypothetical protein
MVYLSGKYIFREERTMANRRFEMYQYRQIIHRMRMGEADRAIARSKVMGRLKCAQVRVGGDVGAERAQASGSNVSKT